MTRAHQIEPARRPPLGHSPGVDHRPGHVQRALQQHPPQSHTVVEMLHAVVDEESVDYGDYAGDAHGDEEGCTEGTIFGRAEGRVEGADCDEGAD